MLHDDAEQLREYLVRKGWCSLSTEEGGFITLPLCWLSADLPWDQLMARAMGYGFYHYLLKARGNEGEINLDVDGAEAEVRRVIGINGGSLRVWRTEYKEVSSFERHFTATIGKTYHPRLDTGLAFEARDSDGITEDQMRVHLALLSALGDKGYVRAGWQPIRWRAVGHLRAPSTPTARMMSRGQIDRALRALVGRGLWRCYSFGRGKNPGERYWTNRGTISLEKLVSLVHEAKARKDVYAENQRRAAAVAAGLPIDLGLA